MSDLFCSCQSTSELSSVRSYTEIDESLIPRSVIRLKRSISRTYTTLHYSVTSLNQTRQTSKKSKKLSHRITFRNSKLFKGQRMKAKPNLVSAAKWYDQQGISPLKLLKTREFLHAKVPQDYELGLAVGHSLQDNLAVSTSADFDRLEDETLNKTSMQQNRRQSAVAIDSDPGPNVMQYSTVEKAKGRVRFLGYHGVLKKQDYTNENTPEEQHSVSIHFKEGTQEKSDFMSLSASSQPDDHAIQSNDMQCESESLDSLLDAGPQVQEKPDPLEEKGNPPKKKDNLVTQQMRMSTSLDTVFENRPQDSS